MATVIPFIVALAAAVSIAAAPADPQSADATRGARVFQTCAACYSLAPGRDMTGPSLAGVWGRKAGSLKSFERYSPALTASKVVWANKSLDAWLASPAQFIPGNYMTFSGISDARQRADIIAFLKEASTGNRTTTGQGGGMAPQFQDLHKVGPDRQVRSARICRDSYFVTTVDGKTRPFWEPNLRFETDSSSLGPPNGSPVIMPAGMMGDRAAMIFAKPDEISAFIKQQC